MKRVTLFLFVVFFAFASSCAGRRRVGGPVINTPSNGSPDARRQFEAEKNKFERDGANSSEQALVFESIVQKYPHDPIVPHAQLYSGMALVRANKFQEAVDTFSQIETSDAEPTLIKRSNLFKGIAQSRLGRHDLAIQSITSGRGAEHPGDPKEQATIELALATSHKSLGQNSEAIRHFDGYYRHAQGGEKASAALQTRLLVSGLSDIEASMLLSELEKQDGPAAAYLASRLYRQALAQGDQARADELRGIANQAYQSIGEEPLEDYDDGKGNPKRLGSLLPLSGKLNRVGKALSRGIDLALSEDGDSGLELDSEDTRSESDVSSEMSALIEADTIAVLGPFDFRAVQVAAGLAAGARLPLLSLTPIPVDVDGQGFLFQIRHSAEERARTLARASIGKGVKLMAIMAPDNRYGNTVAQAFREQFESLGGQIIASARYQSDATSFSDVIETLVGDWEGIFIPDLANKVELIAPALAVADFYARPRGKRAPTGRPILLASTAEGLSEDFSRRAGRYAWGALLAPGFYADRTDEVIAKFVTAYESANGATPGTHEAYAYDATVALQRVLATGAQNRFELGNALMLLNEPAVTGTMQFGPDGRRLDGGLIFQVTKVQGNEYLLRARR